MLSDTNLLIPHGAACRIAAARAGAFAGVTALGAFDLSGSARIRLPAGLVGAGTAPAPVGRCDTALAADPGRQDNLPALPERTFGRHDPGER